MLRRKIGIVTDEPQRGVDSLPLGRVPSEDNDGGGLKGDVLILVDQESFDGCNRSNRWPIHSAHRLGVKRAQPQLSSTEPKKTPKTLNLCASFVQEVAVFPSLFSDLINHLTQDLKMPEINQHLVA